MKKDERLRQLIAAIEEEIRTTPYHKGTEHHIGRLKAKLAKLRRQLEQPAKKGKRSGFAPKKEGDATVVLVGPPSVGKSTLLNRLTGAASRVAPWDFTTLTVIPGMLIFRGAHIQILDLPGLVGGAATGVGRGKEALSVARIADLLLVMVDVKRQSQLPKIKAELAEAGLEPETLPVLYLVNKIDLLKKRPAKPSADHVLISALEGIGIEELKEIIWDRLGLIRVYLAPKGKPADRAHPLILKVGAKVAAAEEVIFGQEGSGKKPLPADRQAFITGSSVPYPNHQVGRDHKLFDEDTLRFA